jgi:CHASE2 domain-containing sensor protein
MKVQQLVHRLKSNFAELRKKGMRYWFTVLILMIIGTIVGEQLGERGVWINLRYRIYAGLHYVGPTANKGKWTALVLIDDEDYWKGPFARRVPLKRDQLAKLIRVIAKAEPTVIALDIDLRSPTPESGHQELADYKEETEVLLQTIKEVSRDRHVVLATAVRGEEPNRVVQSNIFDGYDFSDGKVSEGYVTLPKDLRQVPLGVEVTNRPHLEESFGTAISKAKDENLLKNLPEDREGRFPYGSFYGRHDFDPINATFVLQNEQHIEALKPKLQGKIAIIGGGWHTSFYKGPVDDAQDSVDLHLTPSKALQGAYIQANYVEALLNGSVHPQLPDFLGTIIEVLCSLSIAVVFALDDRLRVKFRKVVVLCVVLVIACYFLWQNLGIFFDFFIPLVLLGIHALIEQLRETRAELRELRNRLQELESDEATASREETQLQTSLLPMTQVTDG